MDKDSMEISAFVLERVATKNGVIPWTVAAHLPTKINAETQPTFWHQHLQS